MEWENGVSIIVYVGDHARVGGAGAMNIIRSWWTPPPLPPPMFVYVGMFVYV